MAELYQELQLKKEQGDILSLLPVLKRFLKKYHVKLETMADYPTYCDMFTQFIESERKDRSNAVEEIGKFSDCMILVKQISKPNIFT